LICAVLLALSGLAFNACCSQKLVEVPLEDAGSLEIGDDPDSGLEPPKKDAGVDAGEHVDAGEKDAGEKDAGAKDAGEDAGQSSSSSGGSTTGGTSSSGGSGNSGSGGGTTSGNAGGSGNGGSGGGSSNGGGGSGGSGSGGACVQDPDLTYPSWAMSADYQMTVAVNNGGLPGIISFFVDMNTFLSTLATFGVPVPQWAVTLFGNLANLQQLFQDINVQSNLALTPGGDSMTYNAQETWQQVSVMQNGAWVTLNSNVGFTSPPAYTVTTCSGTATFSQHDLGGAIGSLIPSVIDAIVNISTCANGTCYASLDDAVNAALDCNQYPFLSSAYVFCESESAGLEAELTNALNGISFGVGVCTVEGTATIQPGSPLALINGVWTGQLSGVPFPGTFSAVE
jgi:hypothetical protein